ncbi:MAG TPA: creatininase family protein, partial [Hyphomicrobiales bacterium]|nr:creatininase family protein [Hyphomicrobiales bacterium]
MTGGKSLLPALACAAAFVLGGLAGSAEEASRAQALKTVELKDMTWVEVRAALKEGYKTVLVPTGGIEQNGPHMVLGKHDYIVAWAAREVALGAGKTLVAPVVSYVPEGGYGPPTGHMRFPGTIGIPDAAFAGLLEGIARSLKTHGFTLICFMGDHGDSQRVQ